MTTNTVAPLTQARIDAIYAEAINTLGITDRIIAAPEAYAQLRMTHGAHPDARPHMIVAGIDLDLFMLSANQQLRLARKIAIPNHVTGWDEIDGEPARNSIEYALGMELMSLGASYDTTAGDGEHIVTFAYGVPLTHVVHLILDYPDYILPESRITAYAWRDEDNEFVHIEVIDREHLLVVYDLGGRFGEYWGFIVSTHVVRNIFPAGRDWGAPARAYGREYAHAEANGDDLATRHARALAKAYAEAQQLGAVPDQATWWATALDKADAQREGNTV